MTGPVTVMTRPSLVFGWLSLSSVTAMSSP
jgi:hypothetical protein